MGSRQEKGGRALRYGNFIALGFGLAIAGYACKYIVKFFFPLPQLPDPNSFLIFVNIGVIVIVVSLGAEIFVTIRNKLRES